MLGERLDARGGVGGVPDAGVLDAVLVERRDGVTFAVGPVSDHVGIPRAFPLRHLARLRAAVDPSLR